MSWWDSVVCLPSRNAQVDGDMLYLLDSTLLYMCTSQKWLIERIFGGFYGYDSERALGCIHLAIHLPSLTFKMTVHESATWDTLFEL